MKKRYMVFLALATSLMTAVSMAMPAVAAGPTDKAMGAVFFDDEGGVPYRLVFKAVEGDPAEGFVRWTRLDGSGWQEVLEVMGADVVGGGAAIEGQNQDGYRWWFWVVDGGQPAMNGDELTWLDPFGIDGEATMIGGNLRVFDRDNGR